MKIIEWGNSSRPTLAEQLGAEMNRVIALRERLGVGSPRGLAIGRDLEKAKRALGSDDMIKICDAIDLMKANQ